MRAFVYFLPILHFFTVMSGHRIASLTIGAASVQVATGHYQPVEEDAKGRYHYLYLRSVEHDGICLIVYYLSVDKRQCYLFREVNSYPTLAECKKANVPLDPQKEEFETWYAPAVFKTYSAYPAIADADSVTVLQVGRDFVDKLMEHEGRFRVSNSERLQNRDLPVIYGGNTYQDILSKALIAHHLNPNATLTDLSQRADQLGINAPGMPRYHSAPRRPTLSPDTTHRP